MSDFSKSTLTAIVRKLAKYEGYSLDRDDIEDIVDNARSTGFRTDNATIETDFGDWTVTDDGHALAVEYVEQMLEDEPEIFNQEWLRGYMSMSDTDIRVYAGDYADSVASDMDESDLEDEIDATPSVIKAQEALDYAEEVAADVFDEGDEDEIDAADEAVTDAEEALEAAKENALDEAREAWAINYADQIKAELRRDALGWFESQYGEGEYPKNLLTIDIDDAADDAVSTDGAAHFLANYDGNVVEVTVNGKTYECYRTN